jgi:hypothetical protein
MNNQFPPQPNASRQYLHTMQSGASLPFAQSTMIAAAVGISTWLIAWLIFDVVDSFKPAIVMFVITWIYMLWKSIRHWFSLTAVETIIQRDINGDGVIGEVEPEREQSFIRVQIDHVTAHGSVDVSNIFDLPADEEQLNVLANGLLNGLPFTERLWVRTNKTFSRDEFDALRNVMKKNGLTEYVGEDSRQGVKLTTEGIALMKKYASPSPAPL